MRRNPLAFGLTAVLGLSVVILASHIERVGAAQPTQTIEAESLDTSPASRVEADQAMDSAIAAALIGAVAGQFDDRKVEIKLTDVDVTAASLRDRELQGNGEIRIGNDPTWIPFEYQALFDTRDATVSYPYLVIGAGQGSDHVAAGSILARQLNTRAKAELATEFPQQPVNLSLEDIRSSPAGSRYLQVEASGTADFGVEGNTAAQVHGLYDQQAERWVRVSYDLGAPPEWASQGIEIASR